MKDSSPWPAIILVAIPIAIAALTVYFGLIR